MPTTRRCIFECQTTVLPFIPTLNLKNTLTDDFWATLAGPFNQNLSDYEIYNKKKGCDFNFIQQYKTRNNRLSIIAVPLLKRPGIAAVNIVSPLIHTDMPYTSSGVDSSSKTTVLQPGNKLEVCIDSLESAKHAVDGGADELEVCSTLNEGGLTPSPGLVKKVLDLCNVSNVMIRCRAGSDFCYSDDEMATMLADIQFYKEMGVDRFVFGALTDKREIDKVKCKKVIDAARPLPVTFHRAFDLCAHPEDAILDIINLGFDRLLTSGMESSAVESEALEFLKSLKIKHSHEITIVPGSGIKPRNVFNFVEAGFAIVHSSCKKTIKKNTYNGDISMGSDDIYVTDTDVVKAMKLNLNKNNE